MDSPTPLRVLLCSLQSGVCFELKNALMGTFDLQEAYGVASIKEAVEEQWADVLFYDGRAERDLPYFSREYLCSYPNLSWIMGGIRGIELFERFRSKKKLGPQIHLEAPLDYQQCRWAISRLANCHPAHHPLLSNIQDLLVSGVDLFDSRVFSLLEDYLKACMYSPKLTARYVSQRLDQEPDDLERAFRNTLYMGLGEFIDSLRIDQALYLLEHSDLSLGGIAYRLGFLHFEDFLFVYKEELGEAPPRDRHLKEK